MIIAGRLRYFYLVLYVSFFGQGGYKSGTRSQGEIGTTLSTSHCCLASTTDGHGDSVGLYDDDGGEKNFPSVRIHYL